MKRWLILGLIVALLIYLIAKYAVPALEVWLNENLTIENLFKWLFGQ